MNQNNFYRTKMNTGQVIIGGVVLVGIFIGLFWLAKGVFSLLTIIAPFMFIAALIINHKVVLGYGKWLIDMLKKDTIMGIIYSILTVLGFPLVSAFLLFKAYTVKKLSSMVEQQRQRASFDQPIEEDAEFEILEEEPLELKTEDELKRYKELFNED